MPQGEEPGDFPWPAAIGPPRPLWQLLLAAPLAYNACTMGRAKPHPIRLAVISHSCVIATNQIPWAQLAQEHPVELTLLAPRLWRSLRKGLVSLELWPGLEGRVRPMMVLPRGHPNIHLWFGLSSALGAINPDVVFLDEEPYSLAAAQLLAWPGLRSTALVVYAKQNLLKRYPFPLSSVERRILARADALVAVDTAAREVLEAKGARRPISIVPHAIDPDLYSPGDATDRRSQLGLRGFVVGYVGRLVPEKGVEDMLGAVALLTQRARQRSSGTECSVLLVGEGPQREQLEAYAQAHLSGPSTAPQVPVVFTGAVPHDQVAEYYRCMDVLVLPSRTASHWREQFGRTIIEALACGVPVIGSDSGAIPTTIGMTAGLVYPEGEVEPLASALEQVSEDARLRRELAEQGRQKVLERFTHRAVADALFEVIQKALQVRSERAKGSAPAADK
ncbi:MAG: glycosyltransferase [Armatimonadetes bacterium]|nr:glycosyltransferase [Armatimonadota bacterium]